MAEGTIANLKRHPIDRFQVNVPTARFAIGGKYREDRGRDEHQQAPWNPIAERADQLGQVDLGHLVGTAHHSQPLAIAALSNRGKAAGSNSDERYYPYRGENRHLRADNAIEDIPIAERAEPQEVDQEVVQHTDDDQRDDDDRSDAEEDYPRSHFRLLTVRDLGDVLTHDISRAEPYEQLEREVDGEHPVDLSDNRHEVQFDSGRREHKE